MTFNDVKSGNGGKKWFRNPKPVSVFKSEGHFFRSEAIFGGKAEKAAKTDIFGFISFYVSTAEKRGSESGSTLLLRSCSK